MLLPHFLDIKQHFDVPYIEDVAGEASSLIRDSGLYSRIKPGERVAVGVGSRGIAALPDIVRAVCRSISDHGARPFIFPAMGSHGGGTSSGQLEVLRSLGITPDTVGTEILSDAKGIEIGQTPQGIPVFVDRHALEADHLVAINRIKPHTKFKGKNESGIMKMMSIGVGKVQGAAALHRAAIRFGFPQVIQSVAAETMKKLKFLFGLALIETPGKKVHRLSLLTADSISQEQELLAEASRILARIPFADIDLLIVDEIGKDISGTGMDTNVTGRLRDILGGFCTQTRVLRIFVRDLTEKTAGNANGIGLADFTTRRLVEKMDRLKTYTNSLAAMSPEEAVIPVYFDTDRECIEAALASIGLDDGRDAKIVRIKNTSELQTMQISEALLAHIPRGQGPKIECLGPPVPLSFDPQGNLS